jgi:hypothetical protein
MENRGNLEKRKIGGSELRKSIRPEGKICEE